jgi:two-component system nitrogen regulation response regulator NtrX
MTPAQEIKLTDLPHGINILISSESKEQAYRPEELPDSYREAKEIFEKQFLIEKLKKNKWNVSRTAEEIGLERSNLHRKMKSYQIEPS